MKNKKVWMKNKDIYEELTKYFLTQDPAQVCSALAAMMVDYNRIFYKHLLTEQEVYSLLLNMERNIVQIHTLLKCLQDGESPTFSVTNTHEE